MTQQEFFRPEMARKHSDALLPSFSNGGSCLRRTECTLINSGELWFNTRLMPIKE